MQYNFQTLNLAKQTLPQMLSWCPEKFRAAIFEHLQTDDSAVEERTPTRINLLKFQGSKQLFSNPETVHVTVLKSLTVFLAFCFRKL